VILPDVNLLIYAYRSDAPQHAKAKKWWETTLAGATEVGLAGPTLFGFVRLMTNARICRPPVAIEKVLEVVESWLALPQVRLVVPGPRHLEIAFELFRGCGTAADLSTDVQLAALAIEFQGEIHSNDSDFARFPGLRWKNPLAF